MNKTLDHINEALKIAVTMKADGDEKLRHSDRRKLKRGMIKAAAYILDMQDRVITLQKANETRSTHDEL